MTQVQVSDVSSHRTTQIENAADALSAPRLRAVFEAVYKGKKQPKSIEDIRQLTGIKGETQLLTLVQKLANLHLIDRRRENNKTYCYKVAAISASRTRILSMARDRKKLDQYKIKNRPWAAGKATTITLRVPRTLVRAFPITIDDLDSFSRVKNVEADGSGLNMLERTLKNGVRKILKENWEQGDWGGETDDLYTTKIKYKGKRIPTAFAFKGRATKGTLTPKKMGKNGDQIQRLFRSPAELFIIQFQGHIDESVIEQMRTFAGFKSVTSGSSVYFMIINGQDTARLLKAYPRAFI